MEKLNLNFSGGDNIIKSICWILSVLSWLLFIITGWISLRWLDWDVTSVVWTISRSVFPKEAILKTSHYYYPIQMQSAMLYIVFILTMIIALAGFIIYMIKSTCKKDNNVFEGMMGNWARFHFCPLLCVSALFIIGECSDNPVPKGKDYFHHWKDRLVSGFVFTIIGLASLIFIYFMTDLNTDWYVVLTLKKGTYSCLIVLLWYHFCYSIYPLRDLHKDEASIDGKSLNMENWRNGCGIAFSIIFGIGSLIFAFFFKDLVVAGMNCLVYIGLTAYYFQIHKEARKDKELNKNGDGAVDIIMMVASVALIVFLILTKKEDCLKS